MPNNYLAELRTTPRGKAIFPKIRKPDIYNGQVVGYTIKVQLTPQEMKDFQDQMYELIDRVRKMPEFQDKDFSRPNLPISDEKDGTHAIKFKSKSEYRDKNGNIVPRRIDVFDAKAQLIKDDEEIPHGSIVKVSYTPNVFWISKINYGISLRINAIQLIQKALPHKKNMTAQDYGFQVEESFQDNEAYNEIPPIQEELPPEPAPQTSQPTASNFEGTFNYNDNQNPLY